MTILDTAAQLASAYAPTAVATNVNGTYLDTNIATHLGMGNTITWYTRVGATATSGGSATVQFLLQGSNDATFVSGTVTLAESTPAAEAFGLLVAGREYKIKVSRVPSGIAYRYYRLAVVIGAAVLTAGSFDSWLTIDDMQDNVSYAAGYTIVNG